MAASIPLILCGKTIRVGEAVIAGLKPQYEVVYFIQSVEAGLKDLPALISGQAPKEDNEKNIGSRNYGSRPKAVIFGGAFDEEGISAIKSACAGGPAVSWMRPDMSRPTPPAGPEYGKHMVERLRARLSELEAQKQLGDDEGVVQF